MPTTRFRNALRTAGASGVAVCLAAGRVAAQPAAAGRDSTPVVETSGTAPGRLTGEVRDGATQQPLPYASVEIQAVLLRTLVGGDGRFTLPNVPPGIYTVRASRVGYAAAEFPDVSVRPGKTTDLVVEMEKRDLRVAPVVVSADPFAGRDTDPSSQQSLSYEEVRRAPGSAADISRTVQALPGVTHTSDQTSELVVRGGAPNENLTVLDDVPIPNSNHFPEYGGAGGAISMLNTELIRGVTFYSGGFPVEFGDKLSSVLAIKLREGNAHELSGEFDVSMAGAGLVLEGPFAGGKGSYLLNGRRSFLDLLVTQVGASAVPEYSDTQGKITWHPDDRNTFTLLGVGGVDQVRLDGGNDSYSRGYDVVNANQWQYAAGLTWKRLLGQRGHALVTLHRSTNDYRYDLRNQLRPGAAPDSIYWSDSQEVETGLRGRVVLRLAQSSDLTLGGELRHVAFQHDITSFADTAQAALPTARPDSVRLVTLPRNDVRRDDAGTKSALFASLERRLGRNVAATAALRWDHFDYGGQDAWSPRAGLTWRLGERWTARASAGVFHQTPTYVQLTQTPSTRTLSFERAEHGVVGLDWRLSHGAQATLEAFVKRYHDLPVAPARDSYELVSTGTGHVRGFEIFVQQRLLERWYGLASYSYSRSERTDLVYGTYPDDWDYRHVLTLLAGVRPRRSLELSARWRYIGGRPFTEFASRFEVAPSGRVEPGSGYWVGFEGPHNGGRLPVYHRLDLRADHRRTIGRTQFVFFVDIENIYARDNILTQQYSHEQRDPEPAYQWHLLPVGGMSLEF